jgi:deferrochelatase/peroxidase EfeB
VALEPASAGDPPVVGGVCRQRHHHHVVAAAPDGTQIGFGRTSSTRKDHVTERNLLGFKDGTNNLAGDDEALMRRLRRGYSFADGIDPATSELDAGLFFLAFQRDPHRQFAALQRRLGSEDCLNEYILLTTSACFAVPPGTCPGDFVGSGLFA